MKSVESWN